MQSSLLASGLGFPEGPTILGGRIVLCDGNTGELLAYENGTVSAYAHTGGSPWGTVLGSDGAIYVTQGGYIIPAYIDALDAYSTKITGYSPARVGQPLSDFDFEHFSFT